MVNNQKSNLFLENKKKNKKMIQKQILNEGQKKIAQRGATSFNSYHFPFQFTWIRRYQLNLI
jgi:hypothetical protein